MNDLNVFQHFKNINKCTLWIVFNCLYNETNSIFISLLNRQNAFIFKMHVFFLFSRSNEFFVLDASLRTIMLFCPHFLNSLCVYVGVVHILLESLAKISVILVVRMGGLYDGPLSVTNFLDLRSHYLVG